MAPDPRSEVESSGPGGGVSVGLVIGVVLGATLALFVAQNTEDTTVTWLVWEAEQPLWAVLLATVAVTFVTTVLITSTRRRRRRRQE